MNEEDKIHINSFKFYDRDELENLTKKYYLENRQLKEQLEASEKARKDAIEELYIWGEALMPEFQQKMLNILNIDKGSVE